jgi:hypothetical protein
MRYEIIRHEGDLQHRDRAAPFNDIMMEDWMFEFGRRVQCCCRLNMKSERSSARARDSTQVGIRNPEHPEKKTQKSENQNITEASYSRSTNRS